MNTLTNNPTRLATATAAHTPASGLRPLEDHELPQVSGGDPVLVALLLYGSVSLLGFLIGFAIGRA